MRTVLSAAALSLSLSGPALSQAAPTPHWIGAWGAPPALPTGPEVTNQTIRQVVRLSLGGRAVRVRLSNELGTAPLLVSTAHIAKPGTSPGSIDPATDQALTFGGRSSVMVPPGAPVVSDPLVFDIHAMDSLAITLFVPRDTGPTATHPLGRATTFLSNGDEVTASTLTKPTTSTARFFLSGVDVEAPTGGAVVTLGDSITDGFGSTVDGNRRWPDVLAERLSAANMPLAVVDAGISGNRVLHDQPEAEFGPSALARLDRDVLAVPGVKTVIVMESINDIGHPGSAALPEQAVSADDIVAGLRQIIDRAHGKGLRVLGATLTPYAGTIFPGYFTPAGEVERQAVNRFIREGGAFDGVIDFDALLRDPAQPDHIMAQYDFGDHLHPNDAGYRKMGEAVDLKMLGSE